MKYEPLYGLQKPFDNGPADSTAYGLFRDEFIYYKIDKTSVYCFDTDNQWSHIDCAPTIPFLAMRRIIPEPKRWTVEDQKTGRLPEVGAKYMGRDVILECVLADKNGDVWGKSDEGLMHCHSSLDINPIETPEEKAARLRDDWCYTAAKQLKNLEYSSTLTSIYDALLSGELPMPSKGGE